MSKIQVSISKYLDFSDNEIRECMKTEVIRVLDAREVQSEINRRAGVLIAK